MCVPTWIGCCTIGGGGGALLLACLVVAALLPACLVGGTLGGFDSLMATPPLTPPTPPA